MEPIILKAYVGIDQLSFTTTEMECEKILGAPIRRSKNRKNETKLVYEKFEFTFPPDGSKILEMSFRPNIKLLVNEIDIFNDKMALNKLSKIDSPLEYVGILFFPTLGISAAGLHRQDDKVVTAISKGRFDGVLHNFVPYNVSDRV